MKVFNTKKELKSHLKLIYAKNLAIGLAPTMGALHKGHVSLVKKAVAENDIVVATIFINPTQFDNTDDLKKYPKTLTKDIALLRDISDKIILFAPSISEMYPNTIKSNSYDFDGLDEVMEGAFRKDHFNGVGTIVEELLGIVLPQRAYFGEKDFQQLQIIKKMVHTKKIPVHIIGCPIVREANGLAMSSRNDRLSPTHRKEAAFIYKTLQGAKEKFKVKSAKSVIDWVENQFRDHPKLKLEYIQITDTDTLRPINKKQKNKKYRAFIAVYANSVRLIDNIAL